MPRFSACKFKKQELSKILKERLKYAIWRDIDDDSDSLEDDIDNYYVDQMFTLESNRYYKQRDSYRKSNINSFEEDLHVDQSFNCNSWLNDDEFLKKYRMNRESFYKLVDLIKDHPIFQSNRNKGIKQAPPEKQLMVFLKYIGTEGSGSSNSQLRQDFRIGHGTAEIYRNRVITAILDLKHQVIQWPDVHERKKISRRIFEKYGWPNCVGFIDGTLFPLSFPPQSVDAPDYSG